MTSLEEEVARVSQALEDLSACGAASVSIVRCASSGRQRALVRAVADKARSRGFVTAEVSLKERGLESPEAFVRDLLECLTPPKETRPRGLLWMLDAFYEKRGQSSADEFAKAAAASDAAEDLTALCRAYLATPDPEAVSETRALAAWAEGVEPPRKHRNRDVRRALSDRTAQRALNELTRVMLALGHRGTVLLLTDADSLISRTERQREKAYTVLREFVDNFDAAGGGAAAMRVILCGGEPLFEGPKSIRSVPPLNMRLEAPSTAEPTPPHRSATQLGSGSAAPRHRAIAAPEGGQPALRNLVRISQGLPPTTGVTRMSVGQERLDRTIERLFKLVQRSGSFFSALVGDYGSGKTHLMMHLAERALEDQRPVFWLNLERTNLDLGNPARHLGRLLEHSQLPLRGRPNALALASRWTRSKARVAELTATLAEVAAGEGEAAAAARKALRVSSGARDPGLALENFLSGTDLYNRPGDVLYRRDAYRRIFLWFELLSKLEEVRGPVILIDEAENMYTSGQPAASRRTSLRSLAFYCGGALSSTCVVLAITPAAFEELKGEARDLLAEAHEMQSTLELEDVEKFRRSLWGLKPDPVRALTRAERAELCERVRKMHASARGRLEMENWEERVSGAVAGHTSPRTLVRALIDELEAEWWSGRRR